MGFKGDPRADLLFSVSRYSDRGSDRAINITASSKIWLAHVVRSQEISAILFGKGQYKVAGKALVIHRMESRRNGLQRRVARTSLSRRA